MQPLYFRSEEGKAAALLPQLPLQQENSSRFQQARTTPTSAFEEQIQKHEERLRNIELEVNINKAVLKNMFGMITLAKQFNCTYQRSPGERTSVSSVINFLSTSLSLEDCMMPVNKITDYLSELGYKTETDPATGELVYVDLDHKPDHFI